MDLLWFDGFYSASIYMGVYRAKNKLNYG